MRDGKMENNLTSAASLVVPENGVDCPPHPGMADRVLESGRSKRKSCWFTHLSLRLSRSEAFVDSIWADC